MKCVFSFGVLLQLFFVCRSNSSLPPPTACFTDAKYQSLQLFCEHESWAKCYSELFELDSPKINTSQVINLTSASCTFQTIELNFCQRFQNLRVLDISSYQIDDLKKLQPFNCKHLEVFNASKNALTKIPAGIFDQTPQLREVNLSGNKIETIDLTAFWSLKKLQVLDLSNNLIDEIPEQLFANDTQLQTLSLQNNRIKKFESKNLANLQVLRIDTNYLLDLENVTQLNFPQLSTLSIAENRIPCQSVSEFFKRWPNELRIDGECKQRKDKCQCPASVVYTTTTIIVIVLSLLAILGIAVAIFLIFKKNWVSFFGLGGTKGDA